MVQLVVCPDNLRFTQDSIACKFRPPYDQVRIDDAAERIQKGVLSASQFRMMNVVRHNGILWCFDNRRLWVFRKAGVKSVTVNIAASDYCERSELFFRNLDVGLEHCYSSPWFYPRVRGRVRTNFEVSKPSNVEGKLRSSSDGVEFGRSSNVFQPHHDEYSATRPSPVRRSPLNSSSSHPQKSNSSGAKGDSEGPSSVFELVKKVIDWFFRT
eukprot:Gb_35121 [translate_table: standard]